ncbi:PREDICTED: serine/arginine repetitive matrix protein 2-like [Priapulus caudatus]|uniref:Serine/arginine repetitive matrix protein 2-like n=1 Tax=Priapulus caudatus TaxID=37621 RepID=A0ABM1E5V6_PRICU|nr:PREDICTED: serine/arginine repetitive matrix protein 2-like [Priapulus caudatus]
MRGNRHSKETLSTIALDDDNDYEYIPSDKRGSVTGYSDTDSYSHDSLDTEPSISKAKKSNPQRLKPVVKSERRSVSQHAAAKLKRRSVSTLVPRSSGGRAAPLLRRTLNRHTGNDGRAVPSATRRRVSTARRAAQSPSSLATVSRKSKRSTAARGVATTSPAVAPTKRSRTTRVKVTVKKVTPHSCLSPESYKRMIELRSPRSPVRSPVFAGDGTPLNRRGVRKEGKRITPKAELTLLSPSVALKRIRLRPAGENSSVVLKSTGKKSKRKSRLWKDSLRRYTMIQDSTAAVTPPRRQERLPNQSSAKKPIAMKHAVAVGSTPVRPTTCIMTMAGGRASTPRRKPLDVATPRSSPRKARQVALVPKSHAPAPAISKTPRPQRELKGRSTPVSTVKGTQMSLRELKTRSTPVQIVNKTQTPQSGLRTKNSTPRLAKSTTQAPHSGLSTRNSTPVLSKSTTQAPHSGLSTRNSTPVLSKSMTRTPQSRLNTRSTPVLAASKTQMPQKAPNTRIRTPVPPKNKTQMQTPKTPLSTRTKTPVLAAAKTPTLQRTLRTGGQRTPVAAANKTGMPQRALSVGSHASRTPVTAAKTKTPRSSASARISHSKLRRSSTRVQSADKWRRSAAHHRRSSRLETLSTSSSTSPASKPKHVDDKSEDFVPSVDGSSVASSSGSRGSDDTDLGGHKPSSAKRNRKQEPKETLSTLAPDDEEEDEDYVPSVDGSSVTSSSDSRGSDDIDLGAHKPSSAKRNRKQEPKKETLSTLAPDDEEEDEDYVPSVDGSSVASSSDSHASDDTDPGVSSHSFTNRNRKQEPKETLSTLAPDDEEEDEDYVPSVDGRSVVSSSGSYGSDDTNLGVHKPSSAKRNRKQEPKETLSTLAPDDEEEDEDYVPSVDGSSVASSSDSHASDDTDSGVSSHSSTNRNRKQEPKETLSTLAPDDEEEDEDYVPSVDGSSVASSSGTRGSKDSESEVYKSSSAKKNRKQERKETLSTLASDDEEEDEDYVPSVDNGSVTSSSDTNSSNRDSDDAEFTVSKPSSAKGNVVSSPLSSRPARRHTHASETTDWEGQRLTRKRLSEVHRNENEVRPTQSGRRSDTGVRMTRRSPYTGIKSTSLPSSPVRRGIRTSLAAAKQQSATQRQQRARRTSTSDAKSTVTASRNLPPKRHLKGHDNEDAHVSHIRTVDRRRSTGSHLHRKISSHMAIKSTSLPGSPDAQSLHVIVAEQEQSPARRNRPEPNDNRTVGNAKRTLTDKVPSPPKHRTRASDVGPRVQADLPGDGRRSAGGPLLCRRSLRAGTKLLSSPGNSVANRPSAAVVEPKGQVLTRKRLRNQSGHDDDVSLDVVRMQPAKRVSTVSPRRSRAHLPGSTRETSWMLQTSASESDGMPSPVVLRGRDTRTPGAPYISCRRLNISSRSASSLSTSMGDSALEYQSEMDAEEADSESKMCDTQACCIL